MSNEIKLIELNNFPPMDTGSPMPSILANEYKVYLVYCLKNNVDYSDESYVITEETLKSNIIIVTFDDYLQYKFGSPNDEALNGHKYYKYGLRHYSFYEVQNSDLIDELEQMNRAHPVHSTIVYSKIKHIIGTFHDSCFEIVAKKYSIKNFKGYSMKECIENITRRLYKN